jgi:ABC-2 type transport system ATP-binding protein
LTAIKAQGLGKVYENGTLALSELDLEIESGTVFGFLGPNGAGKSTATRILNGTLGPSAGRATVLGRESTHEAVRRITATVTETAHMYESLSVIENLRFYARMQEVDEAGIDARAGRLLDRLDLGTKRDAPLGSLSTGMKKRAQLARALMHDPELLFLDEPTSGLDPAGAREAIELIREVVKERGVTVFLCTHDLALADTICDSYGFIGAGSLKAAGSRAELQRSAGIPDSLRIVTTEGEFTAPVGEEGDCNALLRGLLDRGKRIKEARLEVPSLERLYFHFIKGGRHAVA